jgi:hypothetical protein
MSAPQAAGLAVLTHLLLPAASAPLPAESDGFGSDTGLALDPYIPYKKQERAKHDCAGRWGGITGLGEPWGSLPSDQVKRRVG